MWKLHDKGDLDGKEQVIGNREKEIQKGENPHNNA